MTATLENLREIMGDDFTSWAVRKHRHPFYIHISRDRQLTKKRGMESGGEYETDGLMYCSCPAGSFRHDCSHLRAVKRWGGIQNVLDALR